MKVLKFTEIGFVLVIVVASGCLQNGFAMSDLRLSPITQHIQTGTAGQPWGTRISLIPKPFTLGTAKEDVVRRLMDEGFAHMSYDQIWFRHRQEIDIGREVYTREANSFVCRARQYVFVAFDSHNRLNYGEAALQEEGCL